MKCVHGGEGEEDGGGRGWETGGLGDWETGRLGDWGTCQGLPRNRRRRPREGRHGVRTIRIIEHISLDGVIQAPGAPGEDGEYRYGGWSVPFADPAVGEAINAAHGTGFDLLLGRRTYDIWAGYWPKARGAIAESFKAATKYVATHR